MSIKKRAEKKESQKPSTDDAILAKVSEEKHKALQLTLQQIGRASCRERV